MRLQQQITADRQLLLRNARKYGNSPEWKPDEYEHRHALEYASKIERWVQADIDSVEAKNAHQVADDQICDAECLYWPVRMNVRDEMIESFVQAIGQGVMSLEEAGQNLDTTLLEYFQKRDGGRDDDTE